MEGKIRSEVVYVYFFLKRIAKSQRHSKSHYFTAFLARSRFFGKNVAENQEAHVTNPPLEDDDDVSLQIQSSD